MPTLTTSTIITLALALLLAVLLGYGAVVLWRRLSATPRMMLRKIGYRRLDDIVVPDAVDGEIHLEHVYLTGKGLLVLELRNAAGALFAGENLEEWRVIDGARRFSFRNPLPGLAARVHAVQHLAGDVPVHGRVAVVGEVSFASGRPQDVVTLAEAAREFGRDRASKGKAAGSDPGLAAWQRIDEARRRPGD